jgi:hypothetical protein
MYGKAGSEEPARLFVCLASSDLDTVHLAGKLNY